MINELPYYDLAQLEDFRKLEMEELGLWSDVKNSTSGFINNVGSGIKNGWDSFLGWFSPKESSPEEIASHSNLNRDELLQEL